MGSSVRRLDPQVIAQVAGRLCKLTPPGEAVEVLQDRVGVHEVEAATPSAAASSQASSTTASIQGLSTRFGNRTASMVQRRWRNRALMLEAQ